MTLTAEYKDTLSPERRLSLDILAPFFRGIKPTRRVDVSEWAEAYRVLGNSVSNQPGPWRNSVTPYLVAPMNALSVFKSYKHVIVMKGAQIGFSSLMENFIGYSMHIAPANIILMMPTTQLVKKVSKTRIKNLIEDSPVLKNIVAAPRSRDSSNTLEQKDFTAGSLFMVGSNSPSGLSSVNARYLMRDEVSRFSQDVEGEGGSMEVSENRTNTYDSNKKICDVSTPTTKGECIIAHYIEDTDYNCYYIPCPHCVPDAPITYTNTFENLFVDAPPPGFQKLVLSQFEFTPGNPAAVYYKCCHCGKEIHNHHKSFFLPRGYWIAERPENKSKDVIGFQMSSFYSPIGMYSWETMATRYEKAKKNPMAMKTFIQTTLGEPYEEEGDQPPAEQLYDKHSSADENYGYATNQIPADIAFLTCGADVQKDRIECEIVGWGKGKRRYSIDYRVYLCKPGSTTTEKEVWEKMEQMVNELWVRESDGLMLPVRLTFIDSAYSTNEVYEFSLKMGQNRVVPVRGVDTQNAPISTPATVYVKKDGKKSKALHKIDVDTNYYKTGIYSYLRLNKNEDGTTPEHYYAFPRNYGLEHYKRLTIEKKITIPNARGYDKGTWKKPPGSRNEQLDCAVYANAAATLVGIDAYTDDRWDRENGLGKKKVNTTQKPTETKNQNTQRNSGGGLPPIGPSLM